MTCSAVSAAVIYDEAVRGDLPGDQGDPQYIGALSCGENTIQGIHSWPEFTVQGDACSVYVPAYLEITNIHLEIFEANMGGAVTDGRAWKIPPSSYIGRFDIAGNASISFNGGLPVPSASSFMFAVQYETVGSGSPSYHWRWTINTCWIRPQLRIEKSTAGPQVELGWESDTNAWYQLQYRTPLSGAWLPLHTNWIAGVSGRCSTNDTLSGAAEPRFYRVIMTGTQP